MSTLSVARRSYNGRTTRDSNGEWEMCVAHEHQADDQSRHVGVELGGWQGKFHLYARILLSNGTLLISWLKIHTVIILESCRVGTSKMYKLFVWITDSPVELKTSNVSILGIEQSQIGVLVGKRRQWFVTSCYFEQKQIIVGPTTLTAVSTGNLGINAPIVQSFYCRHSLNVTLKVPLSPIELLIFSFQNTSANIDATLQFAAPIRMHPFRVETNGGYGNCNFIN